MRLSLREALEQAPLLEFTLGSRTYQVPPLTFGRFHELLRAQHPGVFQAFAIDALKTEITDIDPVAVGKALAYFPVEAFTGMAVAAVPGLTAAEWKEHATAFHVTDLILFFSKAHDWQAIGEFIDFGKPVTDKDPAGPGLVELTATLLRVARGLGVPVEHVVDLRLEGFYALVEALKFTAQQNEAEREAAEHAADGWTGPQPAGTVVPIQRAENGTPGMDALIAAAEARAREVLGDTKAPNG